MKYEEIRHAWNAQAEDFNQWAELGLIKKVEYAARLGAEKERGPTPIFSQDAQITIFNFNAGAMPASKSAGRTAVP